MSNSLLSNLERTLGAIDHAGSLRLFDLFDQMNAIPTEHQQSYPPSNIIQVDHDKWMIEIAAAGFTRDQLKIVKESTKLTVEGTIEKTTKLNEFPQGCPRYLKRGIAQRNFKLTFTLPDYTDVTDAKYVDGLLSLSINRETPEDQKPKLISLASTD